jgi:hypothetical protein
MEAGKTRLPYNEIRAVTNKRYIEEGFPLRRYVAHTVFTNCWQVCHCGWGWALTQHFMKQSRLSRGLQRLFRYGVSSKSPKRDTQTLVGPPFCAWRLEDKLPNDHRASLK